MIIKTSFTKAVAASMVILIGSVMAAAAATIAVTNANDSGAGSLRDAITQANANTQADTINFDPAFFNVARTITLASEIQITADGANPGRAVTINGPGASLLIISGNNACRPLYTAPYSTVAMKGLTIRDGNGVGTVLNLEGRSGGAIIVDFQTDLTLTDVTVRNNTVANSGGGIFLNGARNFSVSGSIFTENNARDGGAIVDSGSNVKTLVNTTISNNTAITRWGGAYFDFFTTTISNCLITGNSAGADLNVAPAGGGGSVGGLGLFQTVATVTDTTISNNVAGRSPSSTFQGREGNIGGVNVDSKSAIFRRVTVSGNTDHSGSLGTGAGMQLRSPITGSSVEVIDSVVSNNRHSISFIPSRTSGPRPPTVGGGIATTGDGGISIINTTIAGNVAENGIGGGIWVFSNGLKVINSTITGNVSELGSSSREREHGGGGIFIDDRVTSLPTIQNSIIAGNTGPTGPDVTGEFISAGYNIIGSTANSTGFGATGDQLNVNPLLDPNGLQDNGGATLTIALRPGSPAIDKGKSADVKTDQRGFLRPFDDGAIPNAAGGDGSDIGAYEANALKPNTLGNVSTRLPVGTGDNILIEGFIVQGPAGSTKKIMVRAIGPSLAAFGIADALANPILEIFNASNVKIASNDNWKTTQVGGIITSDQFAEINGSGLAPTNDQESAIIANLTPGQYTAAIRGAGNTVGTGIVDAFDISAASASPAKLANVATRGLVQPGDKLLIAGFIVQNTSVKVVVRAIGPSLTAFGISNALPDTTLQLRDQNGAVVRENDDWQTDQKAELEATGLQPSNTLEAALITPIQPGQYTAQVRGKPESTGTGVVEVYFLQ